MEMGLEYFTPTRPSRIHVCQRVERILHVEAVRLEYILNVTCVCKPVGSTHKQTTLLSLLLETI